MKQIIDFRRSVRDLEIVSIDEAEVYSGNITIPYFINLIQTTPVGQLHEIWGDDESIFELFSSHCDHIREKLELSDEDKPQELLCKLIEIQKYFDLKN